ncbi:PREDICTED: basic phospholipase A2 caudoxin-like [Chaetura pelagica]|uniref:basic phospholipase A2 caudoxin-like n=1 Tax=Chaetura pelagica TaxID=8897 RepID=UPI00052384FA|nr:PREDICTED: basic phospholipase A2 caudoxin-like [Chaetura pelagica]
MKLFWLLLCLAGLVPTSCNVLQLGSMIKHKTGKSWLSYNGYGCYCGWGGSKRPLDATDWCCHAHDCCYNKVSSSRCSPKLVTYKYSIKGGHINCKSKSSCERKSCECDKRLAECFQRAAKTYHNSYKNYPNFRCKGKTPHC